MGAAGFGLGFFVAVIGLILSLLVGGPYIHWPASYYTDYGLLEAFTGAVGGLALGVVLRNKKGALALALAGFVGTEAIGGASLGAALGYLQERKLAAEQRPRVR